MAGSSSVFDFELFVLRASSSEAKHAFVLRCARAGAARTKTTPSTL